MILSAVEVACVRGRATEHVGEGELAVRHAAGEKLAHKLGPRAAHDAVVVGRLREKLELAVPLPDVVA
eukprot:CAMPEP_0175868128 /NCGR_PEP_ID=MMETSP0107_2-20121207/35218_1 /TAXON_ID=195067 ORGANISM="Goniomonas pacifica, Strain CCMP1869" /NCGR_SAMPLE_ID=MMETSP0107_2 /ASSEMBLY_ACC=CAM_ASM_000203 /LENGTH=67 /DNA_ID=CAMNT_0017185983 /DNA_START=50 /DNA_END=249 /DNA_ORIENTATION=-